MFGLRLHPFLLQPQEPVISTPPVPFEDLGRLLFLATLSITVVARPLYQLFPVLNIFPYVPMVAVPLRLTPARLYCPRLQNLNAHKKI